MTDRRRVLINLVAVAVLGAVMVGWVVSQLIGPGVVDEPFAVTADFETTGGVFTNQEVTYRGVLVGKVGALTLNDDGVDIELLIEPEWDDEIPADVVASVNSKSAVGEQYVDLVPQSDSGPYLEDGAEIERADTRQPVDVQALFDSLERVLADVPPGATGRTVTNLADALGGRDDEIAAILESLGTLARGFASVAPEQQRLLENSTQAGSAFLATKDEFAAALNAADQVLAGIGDEPEELAAFFEANDRVAREGIALLARRSDDLAAGIRSLADFADYQLREKDSVIQTLKYVPGFLHAIEDASIPWESPDGSRFYRIRVGLIIDNVQSTWPCKYRLPEDYERQPHVRSERNVNTNARCEPQEESAALRSLLAALQEWAREHPGAGLTVPPEAFLWPLSGPITSYFGARDGSHAGIDIDGVTGDPVVAAGSGTVVQAGLDSGYGNAVVIDHGDGFTSLYGHLSEIRVEAGDRVERGEVIGAVGCTGHCFGDHLHFELRVGGWPVDPLAYLPGGALFDALRPPDQPTGPGSSTDASPEPRDPPDPKPSPEPEPKPSEEPTPSPKPLPPGLTTSPTPPS